MSDEGKKLSCHQHTSVLLDQFDRLACISEANIRFVSTTTEFPGTVLESITLFLKNDNDHKQ